MPHQFIEGTDRMATTVVDSIWHRAETLVKGILRQIVPRDPEATALECAGHVFPEDHDNDIAGFEPVYRRVGDLYVPVDSHQLTVSPKGRLLGLVTAGYQAIPFRTLFNVWCLALARAGGMIETLGTFNGGKNFFACFGMIQEWRVPGDHSLTRALLNITGNHTGVAGLRASQSTIRVQCANTDHSFALEHDSTSEAVRAAKAWVSISHTLNAEDRMRDAVAWITDGAARARAEQARLAKLAITQVSQAELDKFIKHYIDIPAGATSRTSSIRSNQRDAFMATLRDVQDLGNHALTANGITAYGLLQTVTRYEDHVARINVAGDVPVGVRRAFRSFLGTRTAEKLAARDFVLDLAK